jgi:hypothetical protein
MDLAPLLTSGSLDDPEVLAAAVPRAKHVRSPAVVDGTVRGRLGDALAGRLNGLSLRAG